MNFTTDMKFYLWLFVSIETKTVVQVARSVSEKDSDYVTCIRLHAAIMILRKYALAVS